MDPVTILVGIGRACKCPSYHSTKETDFLAAGVALAAVVGAAFLDDDDNRARCCCCTLPRVALLLLLLVGFHRDKDLVVVVMR